MRHHNYTGLGIALALHISIPAVIFLSGGQAAPPPVPATQVLPISLSMFKPPPPAPPVVEPVVVAKVEPPPKPKPKPKVKPKPKEKPKVKPKEKPKPKPPPTPEPVVVQEPIEEVTPLQEFTPPVQPQPVAVAKSAPVAPSQPAFDPGKLALIESNYRSQLRQLIESKKQYPRRAKQLGREGRVYVTFVVLPDGTIEDIKIKEGSGTKILDKAAIKTILSVSGKLPFPAEIGRGRWTFTLPIAYELL